MKPLLRIPANAALALCVLAVCSCLLFETRRARDLYVAPGYEQSFRTAGWIVGPVQVHKGVSTDSLEDEARSILQVLLLRDSASASVGDTAAPGGSGQLTLAALIRQREFVREYRSLNAVSVELRLFDGDCETPIAIALYSENTPETIESHAYLYSLIRKALRVLGR